jgi:hypothetical protein
MTLTAEEQKELRLFFRSRGIASLEELAMLVGLHRTTIAKKLAGATDFTPFDLCEWVEQATLTKTTSSQATKRHR